MAAVPTGAEAAYNALDTKWDTTIIAKPDLRIHDDINGPTPDNTIVSIKDGEAHLNYPMIGNNQSRLRDFPVEIHFFALTRANKDLFIKAIEKVFAVSDYTTGCGYLWNGFSAFSQVFSGSKATDWYEVRISVNKHAFISSWS